MGGYMLALRCIGAGECLNVLGLDGPVWLLFCVVLFWLQTQKSLQLVHASACLNTF